MNKEISNHVLEIRFQPNSRFLDEKGLIASQIVINTKFDQWNISTNKVEFTRSDQTGFSAFFSFSNLGVASNTPATADDFLITAKEFVKSAWQYFKTDTIIRLGMRSTFLIETADFTNTFNAYKNKFLKLNDVELKKFDGELIDVGFPLNFINGDIFFNVMTGPMQKKQSKNFFEEKAFESGIYVDIDYFKKEVSPHIIQKHVISFIEDGMAKAKSLARQIFEWTND